MQVYIEIIPPLLKDLHDASLVAKKACTDKKNLREKEKSSFFSLALPDLEGRNRLSPMDFSTYMPHEKPLIHHRARD